MYTDAPKPKYNVAANPHWHDGSSLPAIQRTWLLALLPAIVAGGILYGWPALRVVALSVAASVLAEVLWNRIVTNRDRALNLSSVTLGVLLAFVLPVGAPWWLVVIGAFLTILIGKKLYGGWGAYPVHPVALSYAVLLVSWPSRLDYTASLAAQAWSTAMVEPMRLVRTLGSAATADYDLIELLLGRQVGGVGNALVLWLAIGGLFLLLVREIPWQIPLGCIAGILGCAWILGLFLPDRVPDPLFHLLAGSSVLVVFFLSTDHTTSPVNAWPMVLYGLLTGILLVLMRTFSIHTDCAIFAVLLANLCSPLLDRITPAVAWKKEPDDA